VAVVVFPGSNCDRDSAHAARVAMGARVRQHWHQNSLDGCQDDLVILPGGFSYGDYLRTGAIAARSPSVQSLGSYVKRGGLVLGICNGFQILLEAGYLPGAMRANHQLRFICKNVHLSVHRTAGPFTSMIQGPVIELPIAHGSGNYEVSSSDLQRLEAENRIVFRYSDAAGKATATANPNGSVGNIAGICDVSGRILGMMPHPERFIDLPHHRTDGRSLFESIKTWVNSEATIKLQGGCEVASGRSEDSRPHSSSWTRSTGVGA